MRHLYSKEVDGSAVALTAEGTRDLVAFEMFEQASGEDDREGTEMEAHDRHIGESTSHLQPLMRPSKWDEQPWTVFPTNQSKGISP